MINHYFKTKLTKMGKWATPPLDMGAWHGQKNNIAFKNAFGINKGLLALHTRQDGYLHMYAPDDFLNLLHQKIREINSKNYLALANKLNKFYELEKQAKNSVQKLYTPSQKLTNKQLANVFLNIRSWIHKVTVYDQFGWLAEEYWTPLMRNVLENKLQLTYGGMEYNRVLFALTKPEHISTTLLEKTAVLEQAIKIQSGKQNIQKVSAQLANKFGWLPIFNYGDAWEAEHYQTELEEINKGNRRTLEDQLTKLKNYTKIRALDILEITKKHKISKQDLQIFIEFGLAVDTRNEAEYFISYAGKFLMPIFKEIIRRLYLSPNQLRDLTEEEVQAALMGKVNANKILELKDTYGGWGYNKKMDKQIHFTPQLAEKLFKYVESYVKPIQGGDENIGTCASPGKAKGKIRIVPYPTDNGKVKQGDILVTYATTTDYLPAMKRAGAIITEVGGLTCHAAVVSREFGIPCIVALKNAMSNFKDGELVEVNANTGTVERINRNFSAKGGSASGGKDGDLAEVDADNGIVKKL